MATRLVANEWGVIVRHDGHDLLELQWLPTTADMTDGGFMATLCLPLKLMHDLGSRRNAVGRVRAVVVGPAVCPAVSGVAPQPSSQAVLTLLS